MHDSIDTRITCYQFDQTRIPDAPFLKMYSTHRGPHCVVNFCCRCLLVEGVRGLRIQRRPCLCRNFDRLPHKVTMQFAVMGIVIHLIK